MRHLAILFLILGCSFGRAVGFATEWTVHEQNLMGLGGHIEAVERDIAALVHQSSVTLDPVIKNQLLGEIKVLEAELAIEHGKLAAELRHIRYQHPERGQDFTVTSSLFNQELPEVLPSASLLEELSQRAMTLLRRVYGASFGASSEPIVRAPSSAPVEGSSGPRWLLEK